MNDYLNKDMGYYTQEDTETRLISAEEAYKMTTDFIDNDSQYIKFIMQKIQNAIKDKKYYCVIYKSLPAHIISKLEEAGYYVEHIEPDFREINTNHAYKISWFKWFKNENDTR